MKATVIYYMQLRLFDLRINRFAVAGCILF